MTSLVSRNTRATESLKSEDVERSRRKDTLHSVRKNVLRSITGMLNTVVKSAHIVSMIATGKTGSLTDMTRTGNKTSRSLSDIKTINISKRSFRSAEASTQSEKAATTGHRSVVRPAVKRLINTLPFRRAASTVSTKSTATGSTAKPASLSPEKKTVITKNLNVLMSDMLNYMKTGDDIEGVFRIGDIGSKIAQAGESLKSDKMTADTLADYSLKLKANVLKRMMAELASPGDGKPLFDKAMLDAMAEPGADASSILKEALGRLDDDYRKNNLNSIIDFLASLPKEVPDFVERSKMTNYNLAVVTAVKLLPDNLLPADLAENRANADKVTKAFEQVLDTWTASTLTPAAAG